MNSTCWPEMFRGDGRIKIHPDRELILKYWPHVADLKQLDWTPVSKFTARRLLEMFGERGVSNHSPSGRTTWVVMTYVAHLMEAGYPVRLNVTAVFLDGKMVGINMRDVGEVPIKVMKAFRA